ncbi:CHAT domain-containing protein, partial [Aspergillus brunneoviolaceus CBS 621.78]
YAITQVAGLAANSCSIFTSVQQPAKALQLLEFSRGLILGYLIDNLTDPDQLRMDYPHLATESIELRQNVPFQLEKCLAGIRQQPGYERFLLKPPVEELVAQATHGPLVTINMTDIGSHAIFSLAWLWNHCVKPVLDSLANHRHDVPEADSLPRIWWIGAGAASSLPFHAAGIYDRPGQSTVDYAISSYTPTIKALAYSRSCLAKIQPRDSPKSVLIVAMPETPHQSSLPGVEKEIEAIQQAAGSAYTVRLQQHPGSEDVLQAMQETDVIHFACHGCCDPVNLSESHLLLYRKDSSGASVDRIIVKQISNQAMSQARIAFLSACSTAQVSARKFSDESIHLASAFQVAGFGHVIASLWAADDTICATVAKAFYHYLAQDPATSFSDRSVAEALHAAVVEVRKTERHSIWASFVHFGA